MSTTTPTAASFSSPILDKMEKYNIDFDPIIGTPIFKYFALIEPLIHRRRCCKCTNRLVDLAWTALQRYIAADRASGVLSADDSYPSRIVSLGWHCHTDDSRNTEIDQNLCGCHGLVIYTTFSGPERPLDVVYAFNVYQCLAENSWADEVEKLIGFLGSDKPEEWSMDQLKLWLVLAGAYTNYDAVNGRDVPTWLLNHRRLMNLRQEEILAKFEQNPELTTNQDFRDMHSSYHTQCFPCYAPLGLGSPANDPFQASLPDDLEDQRNVGTFFWATFAHADNRGLQNILAGNGSNIPFEDFAKVGMKTAYQQSVDRDNWSTNLREKLMNFSKENGWVDSDLRFLVRDICQPWRQGQNSRKRDSEAQTNAEKGPEAIITEYFDLFRWSLARVFGDNMTELPESYVTDYESDADYEYDSDSDSDADSVFDDM
ncbi:hypothetical protein B0T21DRAFT_348495 [Apiosordaria backusii]|uniref:Uncharacterized protein n=1 Tax=Apiosordaria backusii TaxID=314023 RepID=A0AA40EHQ9_9PEZI|nr:hypothetical protein B0T21DRAFT_348495 [Apiosordaria backusii]